MTTPFSDGVPIHISSRDASLDRAKGLLIVLVVAGHLVSSATAIPSDQDWYLSLRQTIYLFHMPAFLFIGGVLFSASTQKHPPIDIGAFIRQRADRLLVPFFVVGILVILAKYMASHFLYVANFTGSDSIFDTLRSNITHLLFDTDNSPARMIWYLFSYFLCITVTLPFVRSNLFILAPAFLSILLYFFPAPDLLYLDLFSRHYIFFITGTVLHRFLGGQFATIVNRYGYIAIFFSFFILFPSLYYIDSRPIFFLLFGASGTISVLWLCQLISSPVLEFIGRKTMIIYLMNTFFIGITSAVFMRLGIYNSAFPLFLFTAAILAVGTPLILKATIIPLFPLLDRYTT